MGLFTIENFEHIAKLYSIFTCAIFAGSAIYINLAEHPARMECGTRAATTQFINCYRKSALVQSALVFLCPMFSFMAWLGGASRWWLFAGLMIGAIVPFTFIFISPINRQLLNPELDKDSAQAKSLLIQWGKLHSVRSALSLVAFIIFLLNM